MADDGFARAINPSHTTGDGDTVFALATGRWTASANVTIIGALAAEAMAEAIVRAATQAAASNGLPAARDMRQRARAVQVVDVVPSSIDGAFVQRSLASAAGLLSSRRLFAQASPRHHPG